MAGLRFLACAVVAMLAVGCSSPSAQERTTGAELAAVAPLKTRYPGVVMGFDVRSPETLIVSLDLQSYLDMDDGAVAAMQRDVLRRWRAAWSAAHPHAHAVLHVRFIDFIGRKVADESTTLELKPREDPLGEGSRRNRSATGSRHLGGA